MKVSHSAYYAWRKRPAKVISAKKLHLYRRMKELFADSRGSLGSRMLLKQLRKEGFSLGRYRVRRLMKQLKLIVTQRRAYKVTTVRKHSHRVADNLVDQHVNPEAANQVWAGDITYLRTHEGWLYLAIVMDLHARRIVGWAMDKRMTVDLIKRAITMAITLRKPKRGLIFHSHRGSQYTCKRFSKLLKKHGISPSMSGKGACSDNVVGERFFGSLKNESLLKIYHLTREAMKQDVQHYIRYYNQTRLHSANGDLSPIDFELSLLKVSGAA
jgi:putative transposase